MSRLVGCNLVEFDIPIYGGLVLAYANKDEYFKVTSEYGVTMEELEDCDGLTTVIPEAKDGYTCVVGVFTKDVDILVHECAHVAISIADRTGWVINEDTSEPFCYLIADSFTRCLPILSQEREIPPLTILS